MSLLDEDDSNVITGETAEAVQFLRQFDPKGPWCLVAIVPDGNTETHTFQPGDEPEMRHWIDRHQGARNQYFTVNRVRGLPTKKPSKLDIAEAGALHVDLDVHDVENAAQERVEMLDRLRGFDPPPTVIVDSGGGYQGFWFLETFHKVTVNREKIATLEDYNRGLERALGGDHCHNIDRLMRLPGTVNLPNKKKRKAGRVPALARVVEAHWKREYTLDKFTPVASTATGTSGERDGGGSPGQRDRTRSGRAYALGCKMRREGRSYDEFIAALQTNPDAELAEWLNGGIEAERQCRRIWDKAGRQHGVTLDDFRSYMPTHQYIFTPSGEMWPATSVNARIAPIPLADAAGNPVLDKKGEPEKVAANVWLDKNRAVEQMTWAPGEPQIIADRLTSHAGRIERAGVRCFNLYREPAITPGGPGAAVPWLRHLRRIFPAEHHHIVQYLAHRVQRPGEKVNHALVLGGGQGIGKDTALEPVKYAVGPWNWHEISPAQLTGQFNGFAKSVVLRINEGHDLGDINRYQFYEHAKVYTAAPPDVLRVNEKHLREYYVMNCCGVVVTTNHKTDRIFLPADDRRHFVAWSNVTKEDFEPEYWGNLWRWYRAGGFGRVATYLGELDISDFDPKAPPPRTDAWWAIVDAGRPPEDAELGNALDKLKNPEALVLDDLLSVAPPAFADWLRDRKNRRVILPRLESCGYTRVRNPNAGDGLWRVNRERVPIYARSTLAVRDQIEAARRRQKDEAP